MDTLESMKISVYPHSEYVYSPPKLTLQEIVSALGEAISKQDKELISRLIQAIPSDAFDSGKLVETARNLQRWQVVVFLCSLNAEDLKTKEKNKILLNSYLTLSGRKYTDLIASLSRSNSLRTALDLRLSADGSNRIDPHPRITRLSGTSLHAQVALEILVENRLYESAGEFAETLEKLRFDVWLAICESVIRRLSGFARPTSPQASSKASDLVFILHERAYRAMKREKVSNPNAVLSLEKISLFGVELLKSRGFSVEGLRKLGIVKAGCSLFDEKKLISAQLKSLNRDYAGACSDYDDVLDRMSDGGLANTLSRRQTDPQNYRSFKRDSTGALRELYDELKNSGITPFLVSGTLLGYWREKDVIEYDKDIDLGLMGSESVPKLLSALFSSKKFLFKSRYLGESPTYHVPVWHRDTGIGIDIFVYYEEDDHFVTGVSSDFGYVQRFRFTKFSVEPSVFAGVDVWVPSDIEKKLTENYGDWRVPDPDYLSHLESPSTIDVGGDLYMMVCRVKIIMHLRHGEFSKAKRALGCLQRQEHSALRINKSLQEKILAWLPRSTGEVS